MYTKFSFFLCVFDVFRARLLKLKQKVNKVVVIVGYNMCVCGFRLVFVFVVNDNSLRI